MVFTYLFTNVQGLQLELCLWALVIWAKGWAKFRLKSLVTVSKSVNQDEWDSQAFWIMMFWILNKNWNYLTNKIGEYKCYWQHLLTTYRSESWCQRAGLDGRCFSFVDSKRPLYLAWKSFRDWILIMSMFILLSSYNEIKVARSSIKYSESISQFRLLWLSAAELQGRPKRLNALVGKNWAAEKSYEIKIKTMKSMKIAKSKTA